MYKKIAGTVFFVTAAMLVLLQASSLNASDLAKEKRWAEQTVDFIMDGHANWLNVSKDLSILSIYTEAAEASNKALLVLHGTGIHPNWEQVIQPIRVEMTSYGWNTLAIQMPILGNEADHSEYGPLYPEVHPRVTAALSYLRDQGNDEIVVIAHSQGASMAVFNLSVMGDQGVKGLIAIGIGGGETHPDQNALNHIGKVTIPTLDLFGSEDLESVLLNSDERALTAGNDNYSQIEVEGANHFFDDMNEELIFEINKWLNNLK